MKAPDKIYTTPVRTYDTKPIPDLQDNIYISKDYLLEWAKEQLEHQEKMLKNYPSEREYMAFVGAYQNMIDKIESL